jgi:hypothetical protein
MSKESKGASRMTDTITLTGQLLRANGFRLIRDLAAELQCKEIEVMELELMKGKFIEHMKKELYDGSVYYCSWEVTNVEIRQWTGESGGVAGVTGQYLRVSYKMAHKSNGWADSDRIRHDFRTSGVISCMPKIVDLEHYIEDAIPEDALDKINEAAGMGLKNFSVAYPVLKELPKPDPIVFGWLGKQMVFVAKW